MARTFLLAVVYQMFQYEQKVEKRNKIFRLFRAKRIVSKAFRKAA
jgi:hypothetical protein